MEIIYEPLTMEDRADFYSLAGDPRVAANMRFDCPRSQEESDRILAGYIAEGNRSFALRSEPGGRLWGIFGFLKEEDPDVADLSEMLLPEQWGSGLGQQVLFQMVELAKARKWYRCLDGYVLEHNTASRRMAESVGLRQRKRLQLPDLQEDLIVYRLEL